MKCAGADYFFLQDVRIRRKTDKYILTLLAWVYFLQILDKTVSFF